MRIDQFPTWMMVAMVPTVIVISLLLGLLRALSLYLLWGWFVVPLGVIPITIAWAWGLMLIANLLTIKGTKLKSASGKEARMSEGMAEAFGLPIVTMLVGWLIHTWFM